MKATQEPAVPAFRPITLTLETQAEVDAIFAVLNHRRYAKALGMDAQYMALSPYKSAKYSEFHTALAEMLSPE